MLQYSAQPIPLPIAYKPQLARKDILPEHRPNDSPAPLPPASRLFNKRFTKDRPSRPSQQQSHQHQQQPLPRSHVNHHSPLSISTALPTFSPTSSPLPSPLPLPTILSPAPASPLALPSPLPSSIPLPLPSSSSLRLHHPRSAVSSASRSTSGASATEDVLAPGDFIGEGILLQGHHIRLPPPLVSHDNTDFGLAKEFEVVRKLGTGSYAVVYLVREVLSRAQPSEDGHCGALDLGEPTRSKSCITYGRDFALKCLSKANLDQDALAAQMTEVCPRGNPLYAPIFTPSHRSLSISLSVPTPTSSPSIAHLTHRPSCSCCWSTFPAKICFTSWNRHVTITSRHPSPQKMLHPPLRGLPRPPPCSLPSIHLSSSAPPVCG